MSAPPFTAIGLDHLLLHVRGMAEAEHFYGQVLGLAVTQRLPQYAMVELSAGVTLVDTADPNGTWALQGASPGRNVDHFAILTSAWDDASMRAWLASQGVAIEEERDEETERSFYVRDPSGNLVELLRRSS